MAENQLFQGRFTLVSKTWPERDISHRMLCDILIIRSRTLSPQENLLPPPTAKLSRWEVRVEKELGEEQ